MGNRIASPLHRRIVIHTLLFSLLAAYPTSSGAQSGSELEHDIRRADIHLCDQSSMKTRI